jgi:hypothetical protein
VYSAFQVVCSLPPQAIEQVTASDLPLLAATWERTGAVDKAISINAEHAHLGHRTDKSSIPCTFASCKAVERNRGNWVLRDALVCWESKGRLSTPCVRVVFVVPLTDCRVECCTSLGWVRETLFGGGVSAN